MLHILILTTKAKIYRVRSQ